MRNKAIDMAKGLGMIWIIISHTGYTSQIAKYFYYMYVPIFFVCSAYVFKEKGNIKETILYILKRLLIPLLICRLFYIICEFFFNYLSGNLNFSLNTFIQIIRNNLYSRYCFYPFQNTDNIYFYSYGGCEWFLPSLILSSILFVLIEKLGKKFDSKIYYYCVCLTLLLLSILFNRLPILLPWSIDTVPMCTIFMIFGSYLKHIDFINQPLKFIHIPLSIGLLIILKIITDYNSAINLSVRIYGSYGDLSVILYAINAIVACYLTLLLCKLFEEKNLFLELSIIGQHTLLLYCINGYGMQFFEQFVGYKIYNLYSYDLYCLIKVFAVIVFGTLVDSSYKSIKSNIKKKKLAIQ